MTRREGVSVDRFTIENTSGGYNCKPDANGAWVWAESAEKEIAALRAQLAKERTENAMLKATLNDIADFDCVNARYNVKCDGYCPPCMAGAALNGEGDGNG